ncbi:MAG: hypothetical protein A2161_22615 [Candidatus Schekmanbacteria bacterium RBG_13_48_7]|uniref:Uncharacterized protein n=1 Tax=Candidatus Schekmanbacteria bacterium RBG_13_48_7 TaxID=1817878 RepID=A0A1F7S2H7_9BACT|nr:MAG: hypothetical protein A2161_22615 [Candidatus Schekmanbacteria bacterium RBG_13_48_7]
MTDEKKQKIEIIYRFTADKLLEFKGLSPKQKLAWLEAANSFINKTIGFEKRSLTDTRFKDLILL